MNIFTALRPEVGELPEKSDPIEVFPEAQVHDALAAHVGHNVELTYGWVMFAGRVSVECHDCGEVLLTAEPGVA